MKDVTVPLKDKSVGLCVIFLDFQKAYVNVPHQRLFLGKLSLNLRGMGIDANLDSE